MRKFIEDCLAFHEEDRIGWDKIFSHPLIKEGLEKMKMYPRISIDRKSKYLLRKI